MGPKLCDLDKNNLASAQVLILQSLGLPPAASTRLDKNIPMACATRLALYGCSRVMLTAEQINSIHRLHWAEHWSVRKIARHLHLGRRTISQYLATPARSAARRQRASKLDPFKPTIAELLEQDPRRVPW